ncbi:MAG: DUF5004 domain-containing protein [Chitinophagaceae bacterium]|nr:MAG: DUF5004 domain-containing protein [Chitinophagaceae bacterium]
MKFNHIKIAIAACGLLFVSCKPDSLKELGADRDILNSLTGSWKLTKAVQVDEDAARKGFPYKEKDITAIFPYTDFKVTFNTQAGAPTTFTVDPGASPKVIKLTSGTWSVDNLNFPKMVYLANGSATDTVSLGSYPVGAYNTFKLRKEKKDATTGKLLLSYNYEFTKQ